MIPQLPVELLRHILNDLTAPQISPLWGTVEENDRSTLLALSLTSKVIHCVVHPILYTFVNIGEKDGENSLEMLVNLHRESLALDETRTVHLEWSNTKGSDYGEEEQEVNAKQLLVEFSRACRSLDRLVLHSTSFCLSPFSGSNLKILHLQCMSLHHDISEPNICLPSVNTLILYEVTLPYDGFNPSHFPSLRHIAYEGQADGIADGELETVVAFKLQLDTLHLHHAPLCHLLRQHPSFPIQIALVDYNVEYFIDYEAEIEGIMQHVCVGVDEYVSSDDIWDMAVTLEDTSRYVDLKSLYIPHFASIVESADAIHDLVEATGRLVDVCADYGIEIVEDSREYHTQMSEEFMRRMTEKRLSKDRQASG